MISLRHYPSAADKDKLKKVFAEDSTSVHEKTIAQALLNLNHKPAAADSPSWRRLQKTLLHRRSEKPGKYPAKHRPSG